MYLYNRIEKYLPIFLPLLLFFSRSIADITVITISILFLSKSFYERDFHWLKIDWVRVFVLFIIYLLIINSALSIDPLDSTFYSIGFIRWPLFALAIFIWILKDEKSYNQLFNGILFVSLIFLIDLLYQYYINEGGILGISNNAHPGRLTVPFSNAVFPGRLLIYLSLLISSILFFKKNKHNHYLSSTSKILFTLFITFFLILITGERMSLMIFGSCILLIQLALINKQNFLKIIILNVIFITLYLLFILNHPQILERSYVSIMHKIINFWNSDYGNVFLSSFQKWLENPFFGSGIHQFQSVEPIYGNEMIDKSKIFHAHNYPLNLLVETGITGLIFFYAIIFLLIKKVFFKTRSNFSLMIMLLIFLYISFFPFHSHFKLSHNWINAITWFSVGLMLSISNSYEKNNKN